LRYFSDPCSGLACRVCRAEHFCLDAATQTQCPEFSTVPQGSLAIHDCVCLPGYFHVDDECESCPANRGLPSGRTDIAFVCRPHFQST